MQAILFARHSSPGVPDQSGTQGLLEGANEVEIVQQGRVMARMLDLSSCRSIKGNHQVSMRLFMARRLIWSHAGSMCILQGMPLSMVLGPSWVVLSGRPTPLGDPLPGLYEPILADVFDNPEQKSPEEIFSSAREILGL
jgi:hypothetical protein